MLSPWPGLPADGGILWNHSLLFALWLSCCVRPIAYSLLFTAWSVQRCDVSCVTFPWSSDMLLMVPLFFRTHLWMPQTPPEWDDQLLDRAGTTKWWCVREGLEEIFHSTDESRNQRGTSWLPARGDNQHTSLCALFRLTWLNPQCMSLITMDNIIKPWAASFHVVNPSW